MGKRYYLKVEKEYYSNTLCFYLFCDDDEDINDTDIQYETHIANEDICYEIKLEFYIGKWYPDEYEEAFTRLQGIFPGLDVTEFRNIILKVYPPRNYD